MEARRKEVAALAAAACWVGLLGLFGLLGSSGCGGTQHAVLLRLRQDHEARRLSEARVAVRFVPGSGRGTIAGDEVTLDPRLSVDELAVELAHLLSHHDDRLGDGCAAGLAAAVASESRARALEDRLRAAWRLDAGPSRQDAIADYARRCADQGPGR